MYRLHKDALAIVAAYPELFSSVTRHNNGTATLRLRPHFDYALLQTVIAALDKKGLHIIHFQMSHVPNTIKLSTRNTMVAQSFQRLLADKSTYVPASLGFADPISTEVAAELVGMTVVYIRQLAHKGLTLAKKVGGVHYISRASLIEYVMYKPRAVLLLEYGNASAGTIEVYSRQPADRLPLKLRQRQQIIDHFQEWMVREVQT